MMINRQNSQVAYCICEELKRWCKHASSGGSNYARMRRRHIRMELRRFPRLKLDTARGLKRPSICGCVKERAKKKKPFLRSIILPEHGMRDSVMGLRGGN